MYGTVAQLRARPGMEKQLIEHFNDFEAAHVPGAIAVYCYRSDVDVQEHFVAVVFESKQAYRANAESLEQDRRYRQMLSLLEGEPVWHDGEIVYALNQTPFSAMKTSAMQSERSSL